MGSTGIINLPPLEPPSPQGFTKAIRDRILQAINEKITPPGRGECPLCKQKGWTLVDGFISYPIESSPYAFSTSGLTMPCVAIVCTTCGNTQILNLAVLGLGDLLERHKGTILGGWAGK